MRPPMLVTGVQVCCRVCDGWAHVVGSPTGISLLVGGFLASHLDPVITDIDLTAGGVEMTWRLAGT